MVKKYLEGDLSISRGLQEALMSCTLCEACAQACPSGVRIHRVFQNMRMELNEIFGPPFSKRIIFAALQNPLLMRMGAKLARVGRQIFLTPLNAEWKLGSIPFNRLPTFNRVPFRKQVGELVRVRGRRKGRVLYFTGCATDLINEAVGHAAVEVLTRLGVEVVIPQDQVCCSVPIFLSGARREAIPNIMKNLAIFDRDDADAIVVDCATCGGALKKGIPYLMEDLGLDGEKARRVAAKVKDISEIVCERLDDLELIASSPDLSLKVTYHDPCHLSRSMQVSAEPRRILQAMGDITLVEMAEPDQCCGGAGSFQFEHPGISLGVTARKKQNIRDTAAAVVATGCPGCILTLSGNLYEPGDPKVVHTVQLVAERFRKN
jgi:glycolate oxidase iron-sulfur subunit